ncbi:MAG: hypothetical protein RLZZ338_1500 [Cyanobacteriota bacterium]|jgi:uncharacterized hydrophobic protein (TIGR00271 family)
MSQASAEAIEKMRQELLEDSELNLNFMILTITACLIATFGLLSNSTAVIIGAMIVAPLMMPLRGLAFGALEGYPVLFRRSITSLGVATIVALLLATFLGRLVGFPDFGSEVLARTEPTLIDLGIAVVAGGLSGFAKVRPKVSDALAGTAIAVALMPPLCVVGLSLSQGLWQYSWGAFLLYITNLLGITVACMLVYILAGYTRPNRVLGGAIALTGLLVIPLGLSLFQLLRQSQLEYTLKVVLLSQTITFGQQVELVRTQINWSTKIPTVYLRVRAKESVSPKQVRLVQEFVSQQLKQPFKLVFEVAPVQNVVADEPSPTPKSQP